MKHTKLISKAPEMYEALNDVLNMCNDAIDHALEFNPKEVKRNIFIILKEIESNES